MNRSYRPLVALLALLAAPALGAQQTQQFNRPGAAHEKLTYFVGTWSLEGEVKPSPMGPGGPFTATDTCEWFTGGFFVVCRSKGQGPTGTMEGLYFLGYSTERQRYTYAGIGNDQGEQGTATGSIAGDTWNWEVEFTANGQPMKGRYTAKQVSPNSYTFTWEVAPAAGPFALVQSGTATRKP
jgi:hypothetical protein